MKYSYKDSKDKTVINMCITYEYRTYLPMKFKVNLRKISNSAVIYKSRMFLLLLNISIILKQICLT